MALNSLATEQMLFISHHWLQDSAPRNVLQNVPELAGLLPRLEQTHTVLETAQAASSAVRNQQLKALKEQSADLDRNHDRMVRAIHQVLTGLAEGTSDSQQAQSLLNLRDTLFPQGLGTVKLSYMEEVSEARMVEKRLSKANQTLLYSIPLPEKKKLNHWVEEWRQYAESLGDILNEIERIEKDHVFDEATVRPKDIHRCRVQWIRTVHALQSLLLVTDSLSDEQRARLIGHLEKAQQQVERRKQGSRNNASVPGEEDHHEEEPIEPAEEPSL
jgi:hypothetical protein